MIWSFPDATSLLLVPIRDYEHDLAFTCRPYAKNQSMVSYHKHYHYTSYFDIIDA